MPSLFNKVIFVAVALMASSLWGAPPTADDVRALIKTPPSAENWPRWRDYYVRLYYVYDAHEPLEFYYQLGAFISEQTQAHDGELLGMWKDDPIAWVILARHVSRGGPSATALAIELGRQALERGDPDAMSSHNLAGLLIVGVSAQAGEKLSPAQEAQLAEAERLMLHVERTAPQARQSYFRGLAALARKDVPAALPLLKQGALDHQSLSDPAVHYLSTLMSQSEKPAQVSQESGPFVEQFPHDARLHALHATALFGDGHYPEAIAALEKARKIDPQSLRFVGDEGVRIIEEGRWSTPAVVAGSRQFERGNFELAAISFREALKEDPDNLVAAKWLAHALCRQVTTHPTRGRLSVAGECAALCRQFPNDAELHVAHAAALNLDARPIEALEELKRAEALGINPDKHLGPGGMQQITAAARRQQRERFGWAALIGGLSTFGGWLLIMFAMGAVLAICTPRTPAPQVVAGDRVSSAEVWLERFYVIVLSLSLLVFYVSVPVVVLGLLAITLALFLLLLMIRILHLGILERGYFAVSGVVRSLFLGPSGEVLGIEAQPHQHPRLFSALREVADQLMTRPVDTVHLTPSSLIGVREEGVFRRKRVLSLGISTLTTLNTSEFKSILAHEYAHFSHSDPFYTRFISRVTNSLNHSLAVMNAAGGLLTYVNPFYWMYWLYLRAYALLAAGFSRSREFLADRRAAQAYGGETFISALRKSCVDGTLFEGSAYQSVYNELTAGRAYKNVFDAFRQFRDDPNLAAQHAKLTDDLDQARPRWFDSHPTFAERAAAVRGFSGPRAATDVRPATDLISDFTAVEERLTEMLTQHIHDQVQYFQAQGS